MARHFARWQKLAALAPALLLLVCLPAQMMLRCRIDGLLRAECCCAQQAQQEPEQPAGPTIGAQDCCDRVTANGARPAADVARPATPDGAPIGALAVVLDAAALSPIVRPFDRAFVRSRPAGDGPPLVLLKHAFLI
jgi:hypothetical protein